MTPGVATIHGTIFVDRVTSLPIAEARTYLNPNTGTPQLVLTGTFDYPEQGPTDIYALGLSQDIPAISSLPLSPWDSIRQIYEAHRDTTPAERYIAAVTRELASMGDLGNPVECVHLQYTEGLCSRYEVHSLFGPGPVQVQWREQMNGFGGALGSILEWSRACEARGEISISIFSGGKIYGNRRNEDGFWNVSQDGVPWEWTKNDLWALCPFIDLAWPRIAGPADIIQDNYARENNLIRVENETGVFYLNPDRDYICQRRVFADGHIQDVTEFDRIDTGYWYPRTITDNITLGHTIYLDTAPQFPEGVFDPNNLPAVTQ